VLLNVLYLLACVPIITIGPATAAMNYVCRNFSQGKPVSFFTDFIEKCKEYFKKGVLAWLLLGDYIANFFRMIPFIGNTPFLYSLVGIFSLSDMLGTAITAVSGFMFSFWELFPILR
jgi:uncharacterized membrane protein YesL